MNLMVLPNRLCLIVKLNPSGTFTGHTCINIVNKMKDCYLNLIAVVLPMVLLLLLWVTKRAKRLPKWTVFLLNAIPLIIPIILFLSSINFLIFPKVTEQNPCLWGAYGVAIAAIEYIIERYKKLLDQSKESYEFNDRYSGIQKQWDLIRETNNGTDKKKLFIDESLKAIEMAIHDYEIHYNQLSDHKIEKFAMIAGTLYKDYIRLCSNQNKFYNEIFASLYKYLFYEYQTNVLSSIQLSSIGGADLIIPEFVSNSLTQTIINNSHSIEYQYNTSVVNSLVDFENNVKEGTELKGNQNSGITIQRIIISPEVDTPNAVKIPTLQKISDWHKCSNVDLKFISKTYADSLMDKFPKVRRLDFSIIKINDPQSFIILEAEKHSKNAIIAGEEHELYSVKCIAIEEEPQSNLLFQKLWKKGKTANIINNSVVFS